VVVFVVVVVEVVVVEVIVDAGRAIADCSGNGGGGEGVLTALLGKIWVKISLAKRSNCVLIHTERLIK
jgi:hypothetical protein